MTLFLPHFHTRNKAEGLTCRTAEETATHWIRMWRGINVGKKFLWQKLDPLPPACPGAASMRPFGELQCVLITTAIWGTGA